MVYKKRVFLKKMVVPSYNSNISYKLFDLGHFSFNINKTQVVVTNICFKCITFIYEKLSL